MQFPTYLIEKFKRDTIEQNSWQLVSNVHQNSSKVGYKFDEAASHDLLQRLQGNKPVHLIVVGGEMEQALGLKVEALLVRNGYRVDRRGVAVMSPHLQNTCSFKMQGKRILLYLRRK